MLLMLGSLSGVQAQPQPLTLTDIMHFRSLEKPVIAANGKVIAFEEAPDRGDSLGKVKHLNTGQVFTIAGGSAPVISHDGRYVAMTVKPSLFTLETTEAKAKQKLKADMVLLDTQTGRQTRFERVKTYVFSEDGKHLAIEFE
ncbi:MAG: S9 family peptidase, partial [Shewanella sp.]